MFLKRYFLIIFSDNIINFEFYMEVQDQTKNGLWDDPWIQDSPILPMGKVRSTSTKIRFFF